MFFLLDQKEPKNQGCILSLASGHYLCLRLAILKAISSHPR
jgi:hypothetical protein